MLLAAMLITGCERELPPPTVRDVVERGPLRLTVEVEPKEIAVGDELRVRVTFESPEDYDAQLPEPNAFDSVSARTAAAPEPRPGERGVVWQREFVLEPAVSGRLEIPPLEVKYRRRATAAETQPAEQVLVSGPIAIDVRSALTAQDKPENPRDITATLLPPQPPRPAWHWAVAAASAVGVACLLYFAYRAWRKRALRPPPPILPEVWALRALAELEASDWLAPERVREGYYRLTEIVRGYIERKFGLAAPDMTTEEFLRTLSRDPRALPYDAQRLRAFLEACDGVKYAALQPGVDDAHHVLTTARAFVHATAAVAPRGLKAAALALRSVGGQAA